MGRTRINSRNDAIAITILGDRWQQLLSQLELELVIPVNELRELSVTERRILQAYLRAPTLDEWLEFLLSGRRGKCHQTRAALIKLVTSERFITLMKRIDDFLIEMANDLVRRYYYCILVNLCDAINKNQKVSRTTIEAMKFLKEVVREYEERLERVWRELEQSLAQPTQTTPNREIEP